MILDRKGIVLVGRRHQRPAVNWLGVAIATVIVASLTAVSYSGTWCLLAGEMPGLTPLMAAVFLVTGMVVGSGIVRGISTPAAQLQSLDRE